jgi:CheY-like chemotaxis protein
VARILILEPNPDVRLLFEAQLRQLGHDPVVWEHGPVDLESLDCAVVEPAPAEALERARELRRELPDLPIVFISTRPPSVETAALRPRRHLVKPVLLGRLERLLDEALRPAHCGC